MTEQIGGRERDKFEGSPTDKKGECCDCRPHRRPHEDKPRRKKSSEMNSADIGRRFIIIAPQCPEHLPNSLARYLLCTEHN